MPSPSPPLIAALLALSARGLEVWGPAFPDSLSVAPPWTQLSPQRESHFLVAGSHIQPLNILARLVGEFRSTEPYFRKEKP